MSMINQQGGLPLQSSFNNTNDPNGGFDDIDLKIDDDDAPSRPGVNINSSKVKPNFDPQQAQMQQNYHQDHNNQTNLNPISNEPIEIQSYYAKDSWVADILGNETKTLIYTPKQQERVPRKVKDGSQTGGKSKKKKCLSATIISLMIIMVIAGVVLFLLFFNKKQVGNCSGIENANTNLGAEQDQTAGTCPNSKPFTLTGLTNDQKLEIISAHNFFRSKIALGNAGSQPGSTDMLEMVWNDELAQKAIAYSNECVWAAQSIAARATTNFPQVGQNLAKFVGATNPTSSPFNVTYLVELWYKEIDNVGTGLVDSFAANSQTDRYAQLAWAKSHSIGCGFKVYEETNLNQYQLVCNYGPSGNVVGQPLYTKGTYNADQCTNGCSLVQGLCKPSL